MYRYWGKEFPNLDVINIPETVISTNCLLTTEDLAMFSRVKKYSLIKARPIIRYMLFHCFAINLDLNAIFTLKLFLSSTKNYSYQNIVK